MTRGRGRAFLRLTRYIRGQSSAYLNVATFGVPLWFVCTSQRCFCRLRIRIATSSTTTLGMIGLEMSCAYSRFDVGNFQLAHSLIIFRLSWHDLPTSSSSSPPLAQKIAALSSPTSFTLPRGKISSNLFLYSQSGLCLTYVGQCACYSKIWIHVASSLC